MLSCEFPHLGPAIPPSLEGAQAPKQKSGHCKCTPVPPSDKQATDDTNEQTSQQATKQPSKQTNQQTPKHLNTKNKPVNKLPAPWCVDSRLTPHHMAESVVCQFKWTSRNRVAIDSHTWSVYICVYIYMYIFSICTSTWKRTPQYVFIMLASVKYYPQYPPVPLTHIAAHTYRLHTLMEAVWDMLKHIYARAHFADIDLITRP